MSFELFARVLTAIGAAISIVVALSQLTAVGRLRRSEAFWRTASEDEEPTRSLILKSVRRGVTAELLARHAVPIRELIIPAVAIVFYFFIVGSTGFVIGDYLEGAESSLPLQDPVAAIVALVLSLAFAYLSTRFIVEINYERRRIAHCYMRGDPKITRNLLILRTILNPTHGAWISLWRSVLRPIILLVTYGAVVFAVGITLAAPMLASSLVSVFLGMNVIAVLFTFKPVIDYWQERRQELDAWAHPVMSRTSDSPSEPSNDTSVAPSRTDPIILPRLGTSSVWVLPILAAAMAIVALVRRRLRT